jgi:uncharacterized membrane protein YhaH (DUF805 family)
MQPTNGIEWFLAALKRYVEFSGRSRRREFWYFMLFGTLTNTFTSILDDMLGIVFFYAISTLGLALPGLAVGVRRLHDTNRSGWWYLLPIVNIVFWAQETDPSVNRFGPPSKTVAETSSAAPARPSFGMANLEQIEKLATLRDKGVLTDEEFNAKKAALL